MSPYKILKISYDNNGINIIVTSAELTIIALQATCMSKNACDNHSIDNNIVQLILRCDTEDSSLISHLIHNVLPILMNNRCDLTLLPSDEFY